MGSQDEWNEWIERFLNHVNQHNSSLALEIWGEYRAKRASVERSIARQVGTDSNIAAVSDAFSARRTAGRTNAYESNVDYAYDSLARRAVNRHVREDGCTSMHRIH